MKLSVPCLVDAERAARAHDAAIATTEGARTARPRSGREGEAPGPGRRGLARAAMALAACVALTACNDKITAVNGGAGGGTAGAAGGGSTGTAGAAGGGSTGAGGSAGGISGGSPGTAGSTATGGGAAPGGSPATGGAPGAAGSPAATGGTPASQGGSGAGGTPATGGSVGAGGSTVISPDGGIGTCHAVIEQHAAAPGPHTDYCAALTFDGNPPASGPHYASWPEFKAYDKPVPWGYLLHALEHGAIVISYNCPSGCAADIAAAKAFIATLPNRATCTTPSIVMSPSPMLNVPFAASAWTNAGAFTLKAQCFDATIFGQFYQDHVDMNYESTCGGGDWSGNGWCPPGMTPPCGPGC